MQEVEVVEQVLTDYNLLFFFNGAFMWRSAEQNLFTNRPLEIFQLPGATLEMVIARANTPNSKIRTSRTGFVRRIQRRESAGVLQLP